MVEVWKGREIENFFFFSWVWKYGGMKKCVWINLFIYFY